MYDAGVPGLVTAEATGAEFARNATATVAIEPIRRGADLETTVTVTNLAGHGLPTGVEFRRVFLRFEILDARSNALWASGRTSPAGVILDGRTEQQLATEFMKNPSTGAMTFQPHYLVITRENQVQIYEELVTDPEGQITTSFFSLFRHVKDNRILPKGWRPNGPFASISGPFGDAKTDPDYVNGSGSDRLIYRVPLSAIPNATSVRVTLLYQAIPPYYLSQRFSTGGLETRRLAYIVSRLNTKGTPIDGWTLTIATTTSPISG
jgi:hypothetical protein